MARWRDSPSGIVCGALLAPAILALVCWQVLPHIGEQQAAVGWPTTPGVMTRSEVETRGLARYRLKIEYTYSVGGRQYRAERYRADPNFFWNPRQIAADYPLGASVTVYYNPQDPGSAVLDPGFSAAAILGASLILILAFGTLAWAWRRIYRLVRYGPSICPD